MLACRPTRIRLWHPLYTWENQYPTWCPLTTTWGRPRERRQPASHGPAGKEVQDCHSSFRNKDQHPTHQCCKKGHHEPHAWPPIHWTPRQRWNTLKNPRTLSMLRAKDPKVQRAQVWIMVVGLVLQGIAGSEHWPLDTLVWRVCTHARH